MNKTIKQILMFLGMTIVSLFILYYLKGYFGILIPNDPEIFNVPFDVSTFLAGIIIAFGIAMLFLLFPQIYKKKKESEL